MQFAAIVGQQRLKQDLVRLANGGRMPHAILLSGPEGTGGLPISLAFAQYVFCTGDKSEDSCGECPNCQKTQRLEHADLHLTFPVFGPKALSNQYIREFRAFVQEQPYGTTFDWLQSIEAENKQGNITAEECNKIIENLSFKSYEGGKKIQIVWRPEYLNKEGNKLLKLIEEPPADTLMLFVAENPEDILGTIRSRTQLIRIPPIAPEDISTALISRDLATGAAAQQIGRLAQGSFNEAVSLTQHLSNDMLPVVRDWFNALFTNNGFGLVKFAEGQAKGGREQQKHLLRYVLELLEAAVRATYLPPETLLLPQDEVAFVTKLAARRFDPAVWKELCDLITKTEYFIERNAAAKLQLLVLSIKMQQVIRTAVPMTASAGRQ